MDGNVSSSMPFLRIITETESRVAAAPSESAEESPGRALLASAGYCFRLITVCAILGAAAAQALYHVRGQSVLTVAFAKMVGNDVRQVLPTILILWVVLLFFIPIVAEILLLFLWWFVKSIMGAISRLDGCLFDGCYWVLRKVLGLRSAYVLGGLAFLSEVGLLLGLVYFVYQVIHA